MQVLCIKINTAQVLSDKTLAQVLRALAANGDPTTCDLLPGEVLHKVFYWQFGCIKFSDLKVDASLVY